MLIDSPFASCFAFVYRSECIAVDPEALLVEVRVVRELVLISLVPWDTAPSQWLLSPVAYAPGSALVPLDLSVCTCSFPSSIQIVEVRPLLLDNEPLADT